MIFKIKIFLDFQQNLKKFKIYKYFDGIKLKKKENFST